MRENGERRWIQEGEWDGREEGWVVTHPCVIVCGTRMEREREGPLEGQCSLIHESIYGMPVVKYY